MAQFTFSVDDGPMPEYDSVDAPQEEEDTTRYLVIAYFLVLLIAVGAAVLFLVREMAYEKSTERTQDVDKDAIDSVPLGPLFIPRPSDTMTSQTGWMPVIGTMNKISEIPAYRTSRQPATIVHTSATTKSTVRTSKTTTAEHITTRTRTTMISKPTTTSTANTKTTAPTTKSTRSIMTTEHTTTSTRSTMTKKQTTTSTRSTMTTKHTTTSTGTSTTAEHTTKSTRSTLTVMRTTTSTPSTITTVGTKTSTKSTITTEPTTTSTANTLATEPTTTSTRSTRATEQTTTSTSGTTTTVMTTTTPPSFPPGALICTVSQGFTRATFQFPPDGLCTIVFFDSLDDRRPEQLSPSYQEDFLYFQQTAREHTRTMYGVGFNHRNSSSLSEELKRPEAKAHLDNFWKSNIRHYGHVNFPLYFANPTTLSSVLQNLKDISELMQSKKSSGSPMYTALRVFPRVREYLPAAFRTVFVPDLLIVQASFDPEAFRSIVPCVMTPPLALALPPGASTYYTMSSAIDEMKFLGKEKFRLRFALALALYGYDFKPAHPDLEETKPGNYSVMHKCSGFPAAENMVKVCRNLTFTPFIYDSAHDADFAYSKKIQTTFVYDSIAALSAKLCETKKKILELPYAFAAYGLEYEDSKNACGLGPFARLHYLRKLQEFFHQHYTSEQDAEACKRIR